MSGEYLQGVHVYFVEMNRSYGLQLLQTALSLGATATILAKDPTSYSHLESLALIRKCDTSQPSAIVAELRDVDNGSTAVIPGYEMSTVETAIAAAAVGLPGVSIAAAHDSLVKHRSRALTNSRTPNAVRYWLASSKSMASEIPHEAYPLIAKPSASGGSLGVAIIKCTSDLSAHIESWYQAPDERGNVLAGPVLLEEYVSGHEFSVELMDGQPIALTQKELGGKTGLVEIGHVVAPWDESPERSLIEDFVSYVVSALDLWFGPCHMEIKFDGTQARLIEVNYRLGGDFIPDLVKITCGVDLYRETLAAFTGRRELGYINRSRRNRAQILTQTACIRYIPAPVTGRLNAVRGEDEVRTVDGVIALHRIVENGAKVRPAEESGDRVLAVVAVGDSPAAATQRAVSALSCIEFEIT